jgi:hypothetical protein
MTAHMTGADRATFWAVSEAPAAMERRVATAAMNRVSRRAEADVLPAAGHGMRAMARSSPCRMQHLVAERNANA